MKRLIIAVALVCGSAQATDVPVGSERDGRVQRVNYHEDDVVQVSLDSSSRFTQIVLEESEVVMNTFNGYPEGYEITVAYNTVTVRPISVLSGETWVDPNKQWNTNLSIRTNKRTYLLDLEITNTPAYLVKYYYPTEAEEARVAIAEEQAAAAIKAQPKPVDCTNFDYTMKVGKKSKSIYPVTTCDDGFHTFIEFAAHADMPSVYTGSGEDEALVDSDVESERPNTIRVKTIARKLTLRLNKGNILKVVTITNHSFPQAQE